MPSGDTGPIEEATLQTLGSWLATGAETAASLTRRYLERIDALDRGGPNLRSIIETNPEAIAAADALDEERRRGRVRGPLHGIPVVLKDNIDTADRMQTTAGSYALAGAPALRDATLVGRVRDAGAVILAKTNLSEWANFRSTHSSSGWSARGGQCRNPYVLDRSPSGSSSGSAVAVAANLAALAVGTETDGSIVSPASANCVVGIKPTVGLISRSGIVPIAHSQDSAGPMARTVADAASLLTVLQGRDPRDRVTLKRQRRDVDFAASLAGASLRGVRLGVVRSEAFGSDRHASRVFEEALAAVRHEGAVVIDPVDLPHAGEYREAELEVLLYEFKSDLAAYLGQRGPTVGVRTLADVIAFNEANHSTELALAGQEHFLAAETKGSLTDKLYLRARRRCRRLAGPAGIDAALSAHRLDALLAPTTSVPWLIDPLLGDHGVAGSSSPAAVAGYPSVSVPAGFAYGLPVGVSFFAGAWAESRLIGFAFAFERATQRRRAPTYLPTVQQ